MAWPTGLRRFLRRQEELRTGAGKERGGALETPPQRERTRSASLLPIGTRLAPRSLHSVCRRSYQLGHWPMPRQLPLRKEGRTIDPLGWVLSPYKDPQYQICASSKRKNCEAVVG